MCRSEWPAGSRPPHPADLTQGLPRSQPEGRWQAVGSTLQFAELLADGVPRLDSASYVTTGSHNTFDVEGPREESNILVPLMLPVRRCSGPAFAGVPRFPRPREWESAVSRYRTLFTAFEIRPQDVLLRLPNRRLYIGSHVQEHLVGLDSEWEHLTRWTLGIQNALHSGTALPPFPTVGAAPPAGEALASESGPRVSGQVEPGDGADRGTENPQTTGGRDSTPPRRSGVPLAQPNSVSATPGATASRPIGAEGGAPATRGRRGRLRGSGRESRATSTGRGAATGRGRTPRPGGSEPPPAPDQRGGNGGESDLNREGRGNEGGGAASGSAGQLRASMGDNQEGATCGGCRATVARGERVVALPCGNRQVCIRGAW